MHPTSSLRQEFSRTLKILFQVPLSDSSLQSATGLDELGLVNHTWMPRNLLTSFRSLSLYPPRKGILMSTSLKWLIWYLNTIFHKASLNGCLLLLFSCFFDCLCVICVMWSPWNKLFFLHACILTIFIFNQGKNTIVR